MEKQSYLVPFVLLVCFNLLQFSTHILKVSPLFLLSKLLVLFIIFGGLLKTLLGDRFNVKKELTDDLLSSKKFENVTRAVSNNVNLVLTKLISVVTWEDTVKSLVSIVGFYLLALLLKWVPTVLVTFLVSWVLFLHLYMNDLLHRKLLVHFEPHVRKVSEFLKKQYQTIPRLKENKVL